MVTMGQGPGDLLSSAAWADADTWQRHLPGAMVLRVACVILSGNFRDFATPDRKS